MAKDRQEATKRRSHKARFPTPGFYGFSTVLNLVAVPLSLLLLVGHFGDLMLTLFAVLSVLGIVIAVYSLMLKPKESNRRERKILLAFSTAFGFLLVVVPLVNILINPSLLLS